MTPVSAQGLGGSGRGAQQEMITPPVPLQAVPAHSAMGCQDSSSCPANCQLPEVSPRPCSSLSPLSLPFEGHSLTPCPSTPFFLSRVSPVRGATTAVPEDPTAALMGNPVSQTWVRGDTGRGQGWALRDRMDAGMSHLSLQPPVLSPVLMASPSVLMMPHAV